jgi:hypothetical protein
LAGKAGCFTVPRNHVHGLSQSKMGGWGGGQTGRIVDRTDRAGLQTIFHPSILRRGMIILCNSAGYIYGGSVLRAAEEGPWSSSKGIPRG